METALERVENGCGRIVCQLEGLASTREVVDGTGPMPNETQFPCRTPAACLAYFPVYSSTKREGRSPPVVRTVVQWTMLTPPPPPVTKEGVRLGIASSVGPPSQTGGPENAREWAEVLTSRLRVCPTSCHSPGTGVAQDRLSPEMGGDRQGQYQRPAVHTPTSYLPHNHRRGLGVGLGDPPPRSARRKRCRAQKEEKERTKGKESLWLLMSGK